MKFPRFPEPMELLFYLIALALGIAAIGSGVQCAVRQPERVLEQNAIRECVAKTGKPLECKTIFEEEDRR